MSKILEGNPVKKANQKIEYTNDMLEDLDNCSDPETGYMYFITNYGFIKHPSRGQIVYQPYDYQKKLLHVYHNYRFSINMLGRQMGKAFIYNTLILTTSGLKTIEDIAIGDMVFGKDGKPTRVVNKTDKQIDHICYNLTFDNGENIEADESHEWEVSVNAADPTIKTTKELFSLISAGHSIKIQKNDALEIRKKVIDNDPYEEGLLVGNGINTIRDSYIMNSVEVRIEFVRGLMDSNMGVVKNGVCYFTIKDHVTFNKVRKLLSIMGIKSYTGNKIIKFVCDENTAVVNNESFMENNHHHLITKIEPTDSKPVYCIEVNNSDNMFLVGTTLIPTHNCVLGDKKIRVRNKKTKEIHELTIEEFHNLQK